MTGKSIKMLSFVLALVLCLSLCACGSYQGKWELENTSLYDEIKALGGQGAVMTKGELDLKNDNSFTLEYSHNTTVRVDDGDPWTNDNTRFHKVISGEGTYVINESEITFTFTHIEASEEINGKMETKTTDGETVVNTKVEDGKLTMEIEGMTLEFKK